MYGQAMQVRFRRQEIFQWSVDTCHQTYLREYQVNDPMELYKGIAEF